MESSFWFEMIVTKTMDGIFQEILKSMQSEKAFSFVSTFLY